MIWGSRVSVAEPTGRVGRQIAKSPPKAYLRLLVGGQESALRGSGWVGARKRRRSLLAR
jgi:hypothetical protein